MKTFYGSFSLFLIVLLDVIYATWWHLGIIGLPDANRILSDMEKCWRYPHLSYNQKRMICGKVHLGNTIILSANLILHECKSVHKHDRWNCTLQHNGMTSQKLFAKVQSINGKEDAFLHGLTGVAVATSYIRECSRGTQPFCPCGRNPQKRAPTNAAYKWGGCSSNIRHGNKFVRKFLERQEDKNSAEGVMNRWNIRAGRRLVKRMAKSVCSCMGPYHTCTVKYCRRMVVRVSALSLTIKRLADESTLVRHDNRRTRTRTRGRSRSRSQIRAVHPTDADQLHKDALVRLAAGPSYCTANAAQGSHGTRGRECRRPDPLGPGTGTGRPTRSVSSAGHCGVLCCGRGHDAVEVRRYEDCNCRFQWCCQVRCERCLRNMTLHVCK